MNRFIKLNPDSDALVQMLATGKHREFALLTLIAKRARRTDDPISGLKIGEAMVGDYASFGMTRQQFRTSLNNLRDWQIVTTRTTNKGTIAKLVNSDVYDINAEESNQQSNQPATSQQPSNNQPATTNKNVKKEKNEKNGKKVTGRASAHPLPDDFEITQPMRDWFQAQGFTIDIENATSRWQDAMIAKGNKYSDWTAAWRNGMKLAQSWHDQRRESIQPVQPSRTRVQRIKIFPGHNPVLLEGEWIEDGYICREVAS